jgi:hypothetical protein
MTLCQISLMRPEGVRVDRDEECEQAVGGRRRSKHGLSHYRRWSSADTVTLVNAAWMIDRCSLGSCSLHRLGRSDEADSLLQATRKRFVALDSPGRIARVDELSAGWREG